MGNKLFIDGKNVSEEIDGLSDVTITFQKNTSTSVVSRELSSDLNTNKDSSTVFKTLSDKLSACDFEFIIPVRFSTDICGGINIDTHMTSDGLTCDPCNCKASFDLNLQSPEVDCYNYLDSVAWKQYFVEGYEFPMVWYCDEPSFLHMIVLFLFTALKILLIPINAILNIINFLCFFCPDLNPIDNLYAIVDNWIHGCGRIVPSPYIRDILEFHTKNCGLKFKSSIYQNPSSPYYDEVIFTLESGRFLTENEIDNDELAKEVFFENAPVETIIELLEKLKTKYNADYCIKDGVLTFEPTHIINDFSKFPVVVTKDELCDNDKELEYSFEVKEAHAFHDFSYTRDGTDQQGNSMLKKRYADIVEYNSPPTSKLKGRGITSVQFGAARYMFDEINCQGGFLSQSRIIDDYRDGTSGFLEFLGLGNQGIKRFVDLVLSSSSLTIAKLLILESGTDRKDAKTIRKQGKSYEYKEDGEIIVRECWLYNYPNYFEEHLLDDLSERDLIQRFHLNRNPKTRKDHIKLAAYIQECNCEDVQTIIDNNVSVKLATHYGWGVPKTIDIEFKDNQITITYSDITIHCD